MKLKKQEIVKSKATKKPMIVRNKESYDGIISKARMFQSNGKIYVDYRLENEYKIT